MDRVKIQEIAVEAGASNAVLIEKAKELGYNVQDANSTVTVEEAGILIDYTINGIKPKSAEKPTMKVVKRADVKEYISHSTKDNIDKIKISIYNLKSIKEFEWEFDFKKGIMAVIGTNGIGKSSFIIALAKLIHPNVFKNELVGNGYKNTRIEYIFNENENFIWTKPNNWKEENYEQMPKINGYFESSILGGKRFRIYDNLKEIEVNEVEDTIVIASDFIRENMNYIMYGKNSKDERFETLCKVFGTRKRKKLDNTYKKQNYSWYVLKIDDSYIHEYYFSTGEYFLLSLLKFIEDLISKKNKKTTMIIIDEIELSLHALAQKRLVENLEEFSIKYNIMVVFTTHSLQVIEMMKPSDIFHFQNKRGICSISSPSYSGYLTSRLESHKYYDKIILVEDDLAEMFILEVIREEAINNVLYKIIPIGGWEKVLEIALLNESQKFYGDARTLVVLDGDIQKEPRVNRGRNTRVNKRFLPLENVEKYVVTMIVNQDDNFIKFIEQLILPIMFQDLNFNLKENILSKTSYIKDGYHHFIEAVVKQLTHTSYKELEKRIITYILKQNNSEDSYKKFTKDIVDFINS